MITFLLGLGLCFYAMLFLNPFTNFGKMNSKIEVIDKINIKFSDVAGIDEAKRELLEVVTFLKEPKKFKAVGANIPRGILLVGPPGTGKTLLAKAAAGEAEVPFFSVSGSEFVELFVGVGASRMRDLFDRAKTKSPCIIFIDEIDAIGRERGAGIGSSNDEKEQTLNQLLTEMDGFEANSGIIILAATNRVDILDSALLRPGRFDRQVSVNLPTLKGRVEILKVHAKNKKLADEINLQTVAQRTPGFSGADLANLLNEAAILAARDRKSEIEMYDIGKAIDKVIAGLEGISIIDLTERRLVAYHEVGHALIGAILEKHDSVEKLTIIPRGGARGLTWFTPQETQMLASRSKFLTRLTAALAGRVAEDLIFGKNLITTGARGDIKTLTNMTRRIIMQFGMSNIGPLALSRRGMRPIFLGRGIPRNTNCSDVVIAKVDYELQDLVTDCYTQAYTILIENRFLIDLLVDELIENEVIEGKDFTRWVNSYIPPKDILKYRNNLTTLEKKNLELTRS